MKCEGFSGQCDREGAVKRRQRTAYDETIKNKKFYLIENENLHNDVNYATLCDECQKEADEHWKQMWDDYYSMVM